MVCLYCYIGGGKHAALRLLDYKRFRQIADMVNAYLWCDMAHISGLVAAGLFESPFDYCDVVTTTTHKTLRGPRSGIIFINTKRVPDGASKIDAAVFPGLQGGPHENHIAGVAYQLKQTCTPEWRAYAQKVLDNCKTLAQALKDQGFQLVTGGSDNHLLLIDLKPQGLTAVMGCRKGKDENRLHQYAHTVLQRFLAPPIRHNAAVVMHAVIAYGLINAGTKLQLVCDAVNITLNKNSIAGDSPAIATGVRIGTPAMTTRGFSSEQFKEVAAFIKEAVDICIEIQEKSGKKLADFREHVSATHPRVVKLRERVTALARSFPMPGQTEI